MNKIFAVFFTSAALIIAILQFLAYSPNILSMLKVSLVWIVEPILLINPIYYFIIPIWEGLASATILIGFALASFINYLWKEEKWKTLPRVFISLLLIVAIPVLSTVFDLIQKPILKHSFDLKAKKFILRNINDSYWQLLLSTEMKLLSSFSPLVDDSIMNAHIRKSIEYNYYNYLTKYQIYEESSATIIPQKSISGISIGMDKYEIARIMGLPDKKIETEKLEEFAPGTEFDYILIYFHPTISISFKNDKVNGMSLSNFNRIIIKGYEDINFLKYLSSSEVNSLGAPTSILRSPQLEEHILKDSPKAKVKAYIYKYRNLGFDLTFTIDETRGDKPNMFLYSIYMGNY